MGNEEEVQPLGRNTSTTKSVTRNANNEPQTNKYSYRDMGPYTIHIQHKELNAGNLHPTKLGKLIYEQNIPNVREIK